MASGMSGRRQSVYKIFGVTVSWISFSHPGSYFLFFGSFWPLFFFFFKARSGLLYASWYPAHIYAHATSVTIRFYIFLSRSYNCFLPPISALPFLVPFIPLYAHIHDVLLGWYSWRSHHVTIWDWTFGSWKEDKRRLPENARAGHRRMTEICSKLVK